MVKSHLCDRHESLKHYLIKMMVYFKLRALGHKVEIEYRLSDDSTIDVVDFTSGFVFEIQGDMNKEVLRKKAEKYIKLTNIQDMIPIPLKAFKGNNIYEWFEQLEKYIIR